MTKDKIKNYISNQREIAAYDAMASDTSQVFDTVRGSDVDFPHTEHTIRVGGIDIKTVDSQHERYEKLKRDVDEVKTFVAGISDFFIKRIITLKYIDGHKWEYVASRVGGRNSADNLRRAVRIYFKSIGL